MSFTFRGKELPPELEASLTAYIESGRPTGGFLEAIICNDLKNAVGRADEENLPLIPLIVRFLYNEAPAGCWGRPDSFKLWLAVKHAEREKQGVQA